MPAIATAHAGPPVPRAIAAAAKEDSDNVLEGIVLADNNADVLDHPNTVNVSPPAAAAPITLIPLRQVWSSANFVIR